ncbi:MAG: hypothetical protein ABL998_08925, partial [Planctomycetota bacterium]
MDEGLEVKRYRLVKEVFTRAHALAAGEQGEFLVRACGDDELLRREVEGLLAHAQAAGDFLAGKAEVP